MPLLLRDGRIVAIEEVSHSDTCVDVYNFEVEFLNTYAVGQNGALVHNENGPVQKIRDALNRIKEQLFERRGQPRSRSAVRGAQGELVGRRTWAELARGIVRDHVMKVRNAMRALVNRIEEIKRALSNPALTEFERAELERLLREASRLLDRAEALVPRH